MIISRKKPAIGCVSRSADGKHTTIDSLESYITRRDYAGAIARLQLIPSSADKKDDRDLWIAYCAFHLGDYKQAAEVYSSLVSKKDGCNPNVWTYLASCYFMLGMYKEAGNSLDKGPMSPLQNRLSLHLAHKFGDSKKQSDCIRALRSDDAEDQMSLASLRFLEGNNDDASNAYRQLIVDKREFLALNVYIALCFYKKEYFELSQEVLSLYLKHHPESVTAVNLEACNLYHLHSSGQLAKETLEKLRRNASSDLKFAKEIIDHNMVVFQDGEGAMQVLPPLIGILPEAKQNLTISYLNSGETEKALGLVKDLEPTNLQEYILVAAVYATIGQDSGSMEYLQKAVQYFRIAASSEASETVLGRESLASAFFLLKQFTEAIEVLDSIKSYFINDDRFNFNYGQAKMAMGLYREAIEALSMVRNEKLKQDLVYRFCLTKSYIMAGKASLAFEFFGQMEVTADSLLLLNIMANLCYKSGQFLVAAKSFDLLERLHLNNTDIWEGKRGACIGHFQRIIAGQEPNARNGPEQTGTPFSFVKCIGIIVPFLRDMLERIRTPFRIQLTEILALLKSSPNAQAPEIARIMRNWAKDQRDLMTASYLGST